MSKRSSRRIQIQERDVAILRDLLELRVMTRIHVATLHFDGSMEATKKRLQALKSVDLIQERWWGIREPAALFIGNGGVRILRQRGFVHEGRRSDARARYVPDHMLKHELAIADVRVVMGKAISDSPDIELIEWTSRFVFHSTSHDRDGRGGKKVLVKPDAFLRINRNQPQAVEETSSFFLEVDRSTESQQILASKAELYSNYYRSGAFAVACGGSNADYRRHPFRLLMVFLSKERRDNTGMQLLGNGPQSLTQVWLATLREVVSDPLGQIWLRPKDYREALVSIPANGVELQSRPDNSRPDLLGVQFEERLRKHRLFEATEDCTN